MVRVLGNIENTEYKEILSDEALAFVDHLEKKFGEDRRKLLAMRKKRQISLEKGQLPDFSKKTKAIRDHDWKVSPAPKDLQDRRVEITGPANRKMIINGLNSGAKVFMADLEDSMSPSWKNAIEGQISLKKAVNRQIDYTSPEGKHYGLNDKIATLMVRPRGLHLEEKHVLHEGRAMSASIFDFALYLFHNTKTLIEKGSGPYFYLPKIEHYLEARFWNDLFVESQRYLGVTQGTIKATVLIETITASFFMDEILYELRNHSAGLNAGRWDYIFSMIKRFHKDSRYLMPDRDQITMTVPFMRAYTERLVSVCHRRGAHAIGGMSAFIPNRKEADVTAKAIAAVQEDKQREANDGFDGTWVAHPDLVSVAMTEFDKVLGKHPNQVEKQRKDVDVSQNDLLAPFNGIVSEKGVRKNITIALQYLECWLMGNGAVSLYNLMEDAATAEISRAQLWQWLHHNVKLNDGRVFDGDLYKTFKSEELKQLQKIRMKSKSSASLEELNKACLLLDRLVLDEQFADFLTLDGYDMLISIDKPYNQCLGDVHMEMKNEGALKKKLQNDWDHNPRWKGITRTYSVDEVLKLKPSVDIKYSLAEIGAEKFWRILQSDGYTNALGALTGAQAVNMVKGGLKAIYLSGWQVAADANLSSQTYPDQSLYPSNSVPSVVKRIQNALMRADHIDRVEGRAGETDWYVPILADAEAGFGGPLHAFELMKSMIEAGAAAVHFEDQLASEKKCGHLGGKVLVPTSQFIKTLTAARLASDVCGVPSVIVARTDALAAKLLTSDIDEYDRPFIVGERSSEGFYRVRDGLDSAIARGLAYAPYADVLWFETSVPDIKEAQKFAETIHAKYPGKPLTYNCSPSFNWEKKLDAASIASFQKDLGDLGFKFQFITLAGWHLLNYHTFDLARAYAKTGMTAYVDLQRKEFEDESKGYTAVRHQREVGTGYFDQLLLTVTQGKSDTVALKDSTESQQFSDLPPSALVKPTEQSASTTVQ